MIDGCHVGFIQGVYRGNHGKLQGLRMNIPCNSWKCERCRKKKIKKLKHRIFHGGITEYAMKKGYRSKYSYKLLTLTCPGKSFRNKYTPVEAFELMAKSFDKLIRALKKKYGKEFNYLKVVEPQQDGFPHYHVLMVGHAIATTKIYQSIHDLWRLKYKMGFFQLGILRNGIGGGINYMMKYLTKEIKQIKIGGRIFTASRNALEKIKKRKWMVCQVYIGCTRGNGDNVRTYETKLSNNILISKGETKAFINEVMIDGIRAPF